MNCNSAENEQTIPNWVSIIDDAKKEFATGFRPLFKSYTYSTGCGCLLEAALSHRNLLATALGQISTTLLRDEIYCKLLNIKIEDVYQITEIWDYDGIDFRGACDRLPGYPEAVQKLIDLRTEQLKTFG